MIKGETWLNGLDKTDLMQFTNVNNTIEKN